MIVVIPAVSYLFLTKGIDYRIESLEALTPVDSIEIENYFGEGIDLTNHVTLVAKKVDNDVLPKLYDQFKNGPGFQLLVGESFNPEEKEDNIYTISEEVLAKLNEDPQLNKGNYLLIDGDRKVRRVYKDGIEKQDIERHVATILPYVEKKKRKLKNDK